MAVLGKMKRVLLVNSNSIDNLDATGITLRSLFLKVDKEKVFEVYWANEVKTHSLSRSTKLSYSKFSFANLLNKTRKTNINKSIKKNSFDDKHSSQSKFKQNLRQYFALYLDSHGIRLNHKLINEIKSFCPEVIYTIGGGVNALKMSLRLSAKFRIPIVVHHMDNWLHCIQWENNPLLFFYKRKLRKLCKKVYKRGTIHICISEKMSCDFAKETKREHVSIMNSVSFDEFKIKSVPSCELDAFVFVYAGGLHLGRESALLNVANQISLYNESETRKTKRIQLHIYTSEANIELYSHLFSNNKNVFFYKAVDHSDILKVYEKCDALIHVESLSYKESDFFKYSISTKISEYIATGKPILFHGPSNIYLYDFLKQNGFALVSSSEKELYSNLIEFNKYKHFVQSSKQRELAKNMFDINGAVQKLLIVFENTRIPNGDKK